MPDDFGFDIVRFDLPVDDDFNEKDAHCDWCGDTRGSDYFVVARGKHHLLCSLCWGRSPAYQEMLQEGTTHESALRRLGIQAAL